MEIAFFIECGVDYVDGYWFSLEANLPHKYNLVSLSNCPEKASAFSWACQAIVDACNLETKIKLISKPDTSSERLNVKQEVELASVKQAPVKHRSSHKSSHKKKK